MVHKRNFLRFFWSCWYTKALQTNKIWISWRARPTRRFLFEIENNKNAVDIRKFWGLFHAFGLRSSMFCFSICLDELFPIRIISNEIQQQARILPISSTRFAMQIHCLHLARHCNPVNWLLPDDPLVSLLCSDLMLYMAHNRVMSHFLPATSMRSMQPILNNRDRYISSTSCIFCIFCIFIPSLVQAPGAPQQVRVFLSNQCNL